MRPLIVKSSSMHVLDMLKSVWNGYHTAIRLIRDFLNYMDRIYVVLQKLEPIYNMGLALFRENIVQFPTIQEHLRDALLEMIDRERYGQIVDKTTMKDIRQMFTILDIDSLFVDVEPFETRLLQCSTDFYQRESEKLLVEKNIPEYIRKVSGHISEESERATR
ncbi:unnamed protein product [Rotaria sp. Silwood2]|nr:unnamed protein product [Rotaria sp. Silwood2]CAF3389572.1 unnamed protein product [Rotaria sp. Silwood2]CAF3469585.1 unnamed protein product [Rotaria sp. Silwood2]CAF4569597.1 unnamed protein product [Rotaria sp. Silwood2]CAF4683473.1 unnamed protein product [Rotaria sp. Silwood2]